MVVRKFELIFQADIPEDKRGIFEGIGIQL